MPITRNKNTYYNGKKGDTEIMDGKALKWLGFLAMGLGFGVSLLTKHVDKKEQEVLIQKEVNKAVEKHFKNQ